MDVLNTRIDHAAGAASNGVEGRFEKRPENCGTNSAPIKVRRAVKKLCYFLCERWNLRFARPFKETSVRIRENRKLCLQKSVALIKWSIERLKET